MQPKYIPETDLMFLKQNFWLVDGGPGNYGIAGTNRRTNNALFGTLNSLKDNTGGVIKKLDRVIVTHNDEDHTAGVYAVLVSSK